jgi:imidazolonepropionase-like amidohydrolase
MKRHPLFALLALAAFASHVQASDSVPGPPQTRPVAIVGGKVYPVDTPPIENGTVVFTAGRITAIGAGVLIPTDAEKIDATGKHVYPGLIQADGQLGLTEIGAVRATNDFQEAGTLNPNVHAERAINPDSELIPVARAGGVLLSITSPTGGQLSGQSAALRLDGWTFEDMTLRSSTGLHMTWPAVTVAGGGGRRRGTAPPPEIPKEVDPLKALRQLFAEARSYQRAREVDRSTPFDSRWDSMIPVLEEKVPLVVGTDSADQMASAVAFARKEKVRLIIEGGYEADRVAPLLKDAGVPVIITGVQRAPRHRDDAYDAAYTLPARLRDAGVTFAIAADRGASMVRNLPLHAATSAGFGLSRSEALRAITLTPAEIFGIADAAGSLTPGKEATLFIADGDILDTQTHVTSAWIRGRTVDLSTRQTRLWKKYTAKYDQQTKSK